MKWALPQNYTRGLHWRRTSIRDGHAAKAVFQRQSFSFTLEPPIHGLFWRSPPFLFELEN